MLAYIRNQATKIEINQEKLLQLANSSAMTSYPAGSRTNFVDNDNNCVHILSTEWSHGVKQGTNVSNNYLFNHDVQTIFPSRVISFPIDLIANAQKASDVKMLSSMQVTRSKDNSLKGLGELGIIEDDDIAKAQKFPVVINKGDQTGITSVAQMLALYFQITYKRDVIKQIVNDYSKKTIKPSVKNIASICEVTGLTSQVGSIKKEYLTNILLPYVVLLEGIPCVVYKVSSTSVVYVHPLMGLVTASVDDFKGSLPEDVYFATFQRDASKSDQKFGWNWFTPLLSKYRKSLLLVFLASFLAQLFGLGIPLMIQQIIDKVLVQGNLSTLNVLGAAMILMAFFQGLLTVLKTYIFVDTTDRMDLTLGSSVIDRLFSLPLSFFDKRPVGELSQRIGELNTIRSFLTGTALMTTLNIIFALLYLIVMLAYSPILTAIALSCIPIYIVMILLVSPVYRSLIRRRAVAQARTQSHLIEVLGGMQTVKSQHFELTSRWKWQDRYRIFVDEGFRSVALGSTTSQIGSFLNQLSGLLVLWFGMSLVLKGELTLGMLIAFRIIASNVTSPLLQLSGLYQGFQKVQLSMERLSDILDQKPELDIAEGSRNQISLPPVKGALRFENVDFGFNPKSSLQINDVSFSIDAGKFVGVVGPSGSGKSTLMKLIPRLYDLSSGRIFIDGYDISKVDLSSVRRQIGIVPQESLLFEGTISENIALNNSEATDEEIIEAAKIACAHDFIMSLDKGYATNVAEKGANLSGGQRQRIAIARTILANPQLLIMDEATSALDYNTENKLTQNLADWSKGRTVLFVTHRLNSLKNSDTILVMQDSLLREQGDHQQLLEQRGVYYALWNQQNEV